MRKRILPPDQDAPRVKSPTVMTYPAIADSVDLPEVQFHKDRNGDDFFLLKTAERQPLREKETARFLRAKALDGSRMKTFLAPIWPAGNRADITVRILARRAALLRVKESGEKVMVEAHWNLFTPYFYQIKKLPIAHPEILDIFARAVFQYAALAMNHPQEARNELRTIVIGAYLAQPELLLASLDIFDKPSIYHIRPMASWLSRLAAAHDAHSLQVDVSAAAAFPRIKPELLAEVTRFVHKVAKNYAIRYVDYLWTQRYIVTFSIGPDAERVRWQGKDIVINLHPFIDQTHWKPALYLSLGNAVMLSILRAAGSDDEETNIYLTMMKTWNRFLSFEEIMEQESVREICGLPQTFEEGQNRIVLESVISRESLEYVDDFMLLMDYSARETFEERLNVLKEPRYGEKTGDYYEHLLNTVHTLNATLMRNNINYSKLMEILRNDNIDHLRLAELLRTGHLDNRSVVDVSEWLLLRTLLYDLINAPKVFRNDYKMLLKVLTKVNKSLIVYIWSLVLDNDPRSERVNRHIAKLITDIFVFDRVKIYEIVADPVECLEAEAVTGYLLNWASLSFEEWRTISQEVLTGMPHNVVTHLSVLTTVDVDLLVQAMTVRASGLIGFYLHRAYRWGSTEDELTERIRSYFPELLNKALKAILPQKTYLGGAMLLLILAEIISDERDGFARNIVITEEDRNIVFSLIKQCIEWDQRHFVMMVGGIAAGYGGNIDGWILQQFDVLMGRYGGGDRVVLRSVVQFDVENLLERALMTAKPGEERALYNKIQLFRLGVDPVVSDQANKVLATMASRYGMPSPEVALKKRDIRAFVLELFQRMEK